MKTKNFFMLFLVLFLTKSMVSQNPVWTLPPYYMDNSNNFNYLPSTAGYSGQSATRTHNSILDKNGDLVFFIVDNTLYSADGVQGDLVSGSSDSYIGNEIIIVPIDDDCEKYFIFYSYFNNGGPYTTYPAYSIFDANVGGTGSVLSSSTYFSSIPNNNDFIWSNETFKNSFLSIAVTDKNVNNERFIYITLLNKIAIYKINTSGISYVGSHNTYFSGKGRCEMEVVEMPNNYRIAYGSRYTYNDQSNPPIKAWQTINYFDADKNTGLLIPSTHHYILYPEDNLQPLNNQVFVKGLEFSPDGNDLYITHNYTTLAPSSIDKYTINSSTPPSPVTNIPQSEAVDFSYSQIEYKNGKLFFVCGNRLATYNLSSLYWDNNAVPLGFTYPALFPSDIAEKTYQLIDQIDGMDYSTVYNIDVSVSASPSQTSCEGQNVTLTASGASTYEWVNSNNPSVILSTNAVFIPQPTVTTTYTVYGYMNECDGQNSITITVNSLPTVNSGTILLCDNDLDPLTLYSGHGKGYSYNWTMAPFYNTVGTAPNLQLPVPGQFSSAGTYCVEVTQNSTGCSNTGCTTVSLEDNSPAFSLSTNHTTGDDFFTMTATPSILNVSGIPGHGFFWRVDEVVSSTDLTPISGTTALNPECWWSTLINDFDDYDGPAFTIYGTPISVLCITPPAVPVGLFSAGHYYLITRGTWSATCAWQQTSAVAYMASSGKGGDQKNAITIIENVNAPDYSMFATSTLTIKDPKTDTDFTIYPNPSTGNFTLSFNQEIENGTVQVVDYTGKVILESNILESNMEIDISNMPSGLYIVKIVSAKGVSMEKLIKN